MNNDDLMMLGCFVVLLGVSWAFLVHVLKVELRENARSIEQYMSAIGQALENTSVDLPDLSEISDSIKDSIADTVEDVLGDLQMPTGMDHIMGAVSAFIQAKIMNSAPPMIQGAMAMVNEGGLDSPSHGEETL